MFSKFIDMGMYTIDQIHSFNCILVYFMIWLYKIVFNVDTHSKCFWFVTVTNSAAMNFLINVILYTGRDGIMWPQGMCRFNIIRYFQNMIQNGYTNLCFCGEWDKLVPNILASRWQVVSQFFFSIHWVKNCIPFHFLDYQCNWVTFEVSVGQLSLLFCDMPVNIFCPLFYSACLLNS